MGSLWWPGFLWWKYCSDIRLWLSLRKCFVPFFFFPESCIDFRFLLIWSIPKLFYNWNFIYLFSKSIICNSIFSLQVVSWPYLPFLPVPLIPLHFCFFFFFFLNTNWFLSSSEQTFKANLSYYGDAYATSENKLVNLWNLFQHILYKYKSTVKLRWDKHDNK